jgi:hypothetical protein
MKYRKEDLWSGMHSMRNKIIGIIVFVQLQLLCNRIKQEDGN